MALERFLLYSFLLHFLFAALLSVKLKRAIYIIPPAVYEVSLVEAERPRAVKKTEPRAKTARKAPAVAPKRPKAAPKREAPPREGMVVKPLGALKQERLVVLEGKRRVRQRLQRKRQLLQVRAAKEAPREAGLLAEYYQRLKERIWQNWYWPSQAEGQLEAVVVVEVLKDGTLKIKGFERRSGNALFDRSAVRAIRRASPVEPPPVGMEVGLVFRP
jgi:colicin import membrane protein